MAETVLDFYNIIVFRYDYMRYLTDIFGLQPLVSRNLSLLFRAGLLDDRREGKMIFYSLKKKLPKPLSSLMTLLRKELRDNPVHKSDLKSLGDCTEYQKKTGKCNMESFLAYMKKKKGAD